MCSCSCKLCELELTICIFLVLDLVGHARYFYDKIHNILPVRQLRMSAAYNFNFSANVLKFIIPLSDSDLFSLYTMRHKFSNFHLIFKMQIGLKMKWNKIFNPSIFDALAIIMSDFHWNITFA